MEAIGEVKGESRDDHQHEDYVVSHANSVSTREVAVETPKEESSNGHSRFREVHLDIT
jgi:hypothetical protein